MGWGLHRPPVQTPVIDHRWDFRFLSDQILAIVDYQFHKEKGPIMREGHMLRGPGAREKFSSVEAQMYRGTRTKNQKHI